MLNHGEVGCSHRGRVQCSIYNVLTSPSMTLHPSGVRVRDAASIYEHGTPLGCGRPT